MRIKLKKFYLMGSIFLLFLIFKGNLSANAQSQEEVEQLIQEASDKLTIVLDLLNEIRDNNEEFLELVSRTDDSLQLINDAWQYYYSSLFNLASEKANQAILLLEEIEIDVETLENTSIKQKTLTYSLLGVFSAILCIIIVYLSIKKIHPWYIRKQREGYENLEIIYDKGGED